MVRTLNILLLEFNPLVLMVKRFSNIYVKTYVCIQAAFKMIDMLHTAFNMDLWRKNNFSHHACNTFQKNIVTEQFGANKEVNGQ